MGSQRNNVQQLRKTDNEERTPESSAVEENVQAIKGWERVILRARSKAERVSDWICLYRRKRAGARSSRSVVWRMGHRELGMVRRIARGGISACDGIMTVL